MNRLLKFLSIVLLNMFLILPVSGNVTKMLKGVVLNDDKKPVSQVTLNIPGSKPVFTGDDGVFSISRVNDQEWLLLLFT